RRSITSPRETWSNSHLSLGFTSSSFMISPRIRPEAACILFSGSGRSPARAGDRGHGPGGQARHGREIARLEQVPGHHPASAHGDYRLEGEISRELFQIDTSRGDEPDHGV